MSESLKVIKSNAIEAYFRLFQRLEDFQTLRLFGQKVLG